MENSILQSNNLENISEPTEPVKEGFVRLYRGETSSPNDLPIPDYVLEHPDFKKRPKGSFFSDSYKEAVWYNKEEGIKDGNITFIDIPVNDLEKYRASNNRGGDFSAPGRAETEFFLPPEVALGKIRFIKGKE